MIHFINTFINVKDNTSLENIFDINDNDDGGDNHVLIMIMISSRTATTTMIITKKTLQNCNYSLKEI